MQGIFSFVRYFRKKISVKGRGPVGLRILKEYSNTGPLEDDVLCESERKKKIAFIEISSKYQIPVNPSNNVPPSSNCSA